MPRKPNYQFERLERERAKAAKQAEKAAAKQRATETPDRPAGERES
ncbi:MAG: hypothetical protein JOZ27_06510 [Caulobacteraceae bacterium]|nr:hypothetical protein [Caulobacteraceae bacterium]